MKIKNNFFTKLIASVFTLSLLGVAGTAFAATPVLSVSQSGNSVTLNVSYADPNATVYLYQRQTATSFTSTSIGTTDSSGNLQNSTQTITFDGSSNPVYLYVMVDNLSSSQVLLPPGTCSSNCVSGSLSLSQTSVSVNGGQSATVVASPSNGGNVTISNNSNTSVATAFASGSSVIITGNSTGTATISVCAANASSQCGSILVSVNNGSSTNLNFSNANPVITVGQSSTVSIYSPSNSNNVSYYINGTVSSSILTTSISGSTLFLYGVAPGTATFSVCQNSSSYCGSVTVTVGSGSTGLGSITVNPSSLTVTVGQTGTATINNSLGSLQISSNSNSSVVSASVSNQSGATSQTVTVYGAAAGSATLSICQTGSYSGCVSLYVQVSGTGSNTSSGGTISFSMSNPVMTVGQSQSIAIYSSNGGSSYTISNNSSSNVASLSLSGSSLYLVGQNIGTENISICQTNVNICGTVYITVNSSGSGLSFSPSSVNVAINQSSTVTITGGSGSYYISSNSSPSVAAVSIQSGSLYITGLNSGTTSVNVCQQSNTSVCGTLAVTIGTSSTASGSVSFSNSTPTLTVGQTQTITINNGSSGSYYISSISNPSAITLNITGSSLSVTGAAAGNTTLNICQTGNSSCGTVTVTVSATANASSSPVSFLTTSVPAAVVGQSYVYQLQSQGGQGSYTYFVASGTLPSGLTLTSSGSLQGTPTAVGTNNFTLEVSDSGGTNGTLNSSITVNAASSSTTVTTTSGYTNGELINEKGTIAIVYRNTKSPFANPAAFLGLGFKFSNVQTVSDSGLALSGRIVVTASGAHPRGTWLISGSTVYFLTPTGLIPVPDWNTFLNNGGQGDWLVKANSYDLGFAKLPLMVANDTRLK